LPLPRPTVLTYPTARALRRRVLAKGVPVDLHPMSFKTGDVVSTLVAHIGVQIERLDDRPTFQLVAFRSLAGSLWSWLTKSAAEFGYEMLQLNRPGTRHVA
jgi:methylglutamate dehydrogenase subunit D